MLKQINNIHPATGNNQIETYACM